MSRGKQSVKKEVWYIGGKYKRAPRKKKTKRQSHLFGLIASLATPVLAEVAKPILGKIFGRGKRRRKIKRW